MASWLPVAGGTWIALRKLRSIQATPAGGQTARWDILQGVGSIQPSTHHPRFGSSETSYCLQVRFDGFEAKVLFQWD